MRALALVLMLAGSARADDANLDDERVSQARAAFVQGTELVKKAEWAEALTAFERSAQLHPHAATTFNIGGCQRVLGRYTLARSTLQRALQEDMEHGHQLPNDLRRDAEAMVGELDHLLARVDVTLIPAEAAISVDGRPLAISREKELLAGLLPPGTGTAPPLGNFQLIVDPGPHVFVISRKGYNDVVVRRSFAPAARDQLLLELARLPATLHITANQPGAIVIVDDEDAGPAPIDLKRPAGEHKILVKKKGFVTYNARVNVQAGEESNLHATMTVEKMQIAKKWWFWTSLVSVVAVGATLTYVFTRPAPPYDGGNTNWVVSPSK